MIEVQTYHSNVRACVCVYLHVLARTYIYVMSWNGFHLCELPIFQNSKFFIQDTPAESMMIIN